MKKLIFLLSIMSFLLLLNITKATVNISTCGYLNASGTYKLFADYTTNATYCGSETSCIYINASDVIIDLNGHQLIDGGGCQYGIHVLAKDPDPLVQWSGLEIKNGNVSQFDNAQIRVQGSTTGTLIHNLYLTGTNSEGIRAEGLNTNMNIQSNYIDTGSDHSIFISGYSGWNWIQYNSLYSWEGIYLSGLNFIVEGNYIGNYYDNNQVKQYVNASCLKTETPTTKSITVDTVYNASIRKNRILSNTPITLIDAININITQNEWLKIPNGEYVTTIDSGSSKVVFCSNIFTETINSGIYYYSNLWGQTIYSYCYWSKNSKNVYNLVDNESSTATIQQYCTGGLGGGCIVGYYCENDTRVFYDSSCNVDERYSCEYGCQEGTCIGTQETYTTSTTSSPTTTIPLSYNKTKFYEPIIAKADLIDASLEWLVPFVTPFFWAISGVCIFAGVLSGLTKSPVIFPIMIIIFMLVFGFFGIIEWWIVGVVIIFGILGTAGVLKQQMTG